MYEVARGLGQDPVSVSDNELTDDQLEAERIRQANLAARAAEYEARARRRAEEAAARPLREAAAEQAAMIERQRRHDAVVGLGVGAGILTIISAAGFLGYRWWKHRKESS